MSNTGLKQPTFNGPVMFESMDNLRRLQGRILERWGFGPRETASHIVDEGPLWRLRCYAPAVSNATPLLIVPAPIKRPYIWDISPERSVVRRAIEHGLGVYLVEWMAPLRGGPRPALSDYAGALLDACTDALAAATGSAKVMLAGHSLGGIFAALYSAYRPQRVAALVLVDVPLHFPQRSGARASIALPDLTGGRAVPGSMLSMLSAYAAPEAFVVERQIDRIASLASRARTRTHWQVERWTLDEMPLSHPLVNDVIEQLYRADGFMRGTIRIGQACVCPRDIVTPLCAVFQPSSSMVPSASVVEFFEAVGSAQKTLHAYPGDQGVALQHVGPLVGDNAHRYLWPQVFAWIDQIQEGAEPARTPGAAACQPIL